MTFFEKLKKLKFIVQGLVTYSPFDFAFLPHHRTQFINDNHVRANVDYEDVALAAYTVWLRFLSKMDPRPILPIRAVGEIGPGDSLGVGLAALLCGTNCYYPIDKVSRIRATDNLKIFEKLVALFKERASIPDDTQFPKAIPRLSSYQFPDFITDEFLSKNLSDDRLKSIRDVIKCIQSGKTEATAGGITIEYNPEDKKMDFIVSNAVMEHVENPETMYIRTYKDLNSSGFYAHAIGLNSHGTASHWNGHWVYSKLTWRLIRGRTLYLINRWPHSWHINVLKKTGFTIDVDDRYQNKNRLLGRDLSRNFKNVPIEDLSIESMFVSGHK